MKNKKIFGIPALALVLGLLVLGGATAAVLTYFGTVKVTANVEQAVVVYGNMDTDLGSVTGPLTHNELLTVKNNNNERNVGYTWVRTSPYQASTYLGVYEVQNFVLIDGEGVETEYNVEVTPGVDTMTYKVNLPENYFSGYPEANADIQISKIHSDDINNYHIKYSSDSHTSDGDYNWMFYSPSVTKGDVVVLGEANVLALDDVLYLEANEDESYFLVTVKKNISVDQSFGVTATAGGGVPFYTTKGWEGHTYGGYHDNLVSSHIVPNQVNLIDEDVNIVAGGEDKYVFSVFADNGFVDDLFAEVSLKPITFLE